MIFLAKSRQAGMHTNNIDVLHHFMRNMVKEKDIDFKYIRSEENPADIMTKNTYEVRFLKHKKIITEGELWELVETGSDNVKNTRSKDNVIKRDKTEYCSHALDEVVDGEDRND